MWSRTKLETKGEEKEEKEEEHKKKFLDEREKKRTEEKQEKKPHNKKKNSQLGVFPILHCFSGDELFFKHRPGLPQI